MASAAKVNKTETVVVLTLSKDEASSLNRLLCTLASLGGIYNEYFTFSASRVDVSSLIPIRSALLAAL